MIYFSKTNLVGYLLLALLPALFAMREMMLHSADIEWLCLGLGLSVVLAGAAIAGHIRGKRVQK
ncbi:MAG TPA: hypothetical protein VFZ48_03985 [Candidatus Saccharimonadales bacterium]